MTENPMNPPSQPTDPGNDQNTQHSKKRRGHFASDGFVPRRPVSSPPNPETSESESVASQPPGASNRFGAGDPKPVLSKQPKQPVSSAPAPVPIQPLRTPVDGPFEFARLFLLAVILVPLCLWASFSAWESMVYEWYHTDDYSHGFIVIPATLLFLYLRLETYPGTRYKLDWIGLFPILLYGVARIFAGLQYITPLDAYAIWFWVLGVVWFFYGWRVFLWALPSLCFLVFMFQLPYSVDVLMKNKLQLFAAQFAATLLQIVGVTAVPIKNTIRLSTMELGIEEACSGLRFLMSVFAIAFAAMLLLRRPWWQNILIFAVAAPLALFVNAARIAITGVILENHYELMATWTPDGETVGAAADVFAGKVAIVLALGLFAVFVWYLGKVFRRVEI